eukprot:Phypoly_transcript_01171.p1 GENE.Phypoly_transcript_01171~~Phypoly_transcript_01171.p1  ORF type:complete len:1117 (+),score=199.88 Phypoly_transcript_01171:88-3438(+)
MKSSPFFRQFSKPASQPADSKPLSSSRSLSLPSSRPAEEEGPTPAHQMKPAHQPPVRSATYNAGFSNFSTTNQAVNLPIAYTPINNTSTNATPTNTNINFSTITTTTTTNTGNNSTVPVPTTNNNHEDSIQSPPASPSKIKGKEKVRNSAANNLATKIVQKSTQRLRTPSSATVDSMTIVQAQQMMGDATNTAHIVISKRDPTLPTPAPPPTVISIPSNPPVVSKHFNNNSLHPTTTNTTTTTTTSTKSTPAKPHSNAAPRRSPRNEKKIPLTAQEKKDFEDIVKLIETEGKNLPLIWAAKVSIVPHLEFLVSIMNKEGVNIDINHQDGHGKTALHYAAARGYKEICVILLKHHANVSLQDCEEYFTPLHHAARSKHAEIVELLLNYGADVSIKDARGLTVLHTTAGAGNQELFALLARHCTKSINDYKDKYGRTCLYSALKYKAKDMIHTLICKYNADPFVQDLASVNCIQCCAMDQRYLLGVMYNAYISKYPNGVQRFVDCVDARGRTPIMYALRRDSKSPIKVAEFLISLKANLNVQDSRTGETPLHMAAQTGPLQLVQLLLNNGASPNTRNNSGELPLDLAVHVDIINALRKVTVASPKRKRADSDSDGEYETQADPEPRKRNIEHLKHGFAGLNPEKKLKESTAFLGGDDDSTILSAPSTKTQTHDLKKAVHHIHISPSSSPSHSHINLNPNNNNNNNNNIHTTSNNNFTKNNNADINNNTNFNTNNNNTQPVNNVFIHNTISHTSVGTSINNNTTIHNNSTNNTTIHHTTHHNTASNVTNNITINNNNNTTNNATVNNNTTNKSHDNPSTETYTNSAPLATQATPYPLDSQAPLAVTLGPLAQQFIIMEADLVMAEVLGTGSFGEVVKGKYRDNAVAIKCMHKNLQSMQHAVSLYVNEIELMCRVRHPNVVRIFGCTAPPLVYIVMDYYPSNLSQLIQKWSRIPTPVLLKIAKGIANGLFYLHNVAKIIHRDMKPSNVLLDDKNNPKIADFGVARDNAGTLTMTGIGTPTYMAPEMLKGRKYSDKVDVYSFGLILWQMFTGQKPFADLKMNDGAEISPVQIAVKVATHRIRPKIPADCPPSLSELITQCWEHDPKKRLSSEELVAILDDV